MNFGMVSIIVVSYNQGRYISECLNSILLQTYSNWELILADDFSTDDSKNVFEDWVKMQSDSHVIKKVYNIENRGLCKTVNECLLKCDGEFIKLIAADDFLCESFLEESLRFFNDDNVGAVFSDSYVVNEDSLVQKEKYIGQHRKFSSGWIFNDLIKGNFIPANTLIIKTDVYKKLGNYDEDIWIEDWEFSLRMAQHCKIIYTKKCLAYYRAHSLNISSTTNLQMIPAEWAILRKYDQDGKYKATLNWFAKHGLYPYPDRKRAIELISDYPFHNKILLFCLRNNIPWLVYKIYAKFFGD